MNIGTRYKLEDDSLNIILYERHKAKTGKIYWRPMGYYSTPQNALRALADIKIKESAFRDMQAITKKQDEIYALINSLPTTKSSVACKRGIKQ